MKSAPTTGSRWARSPGRRIRTCTPTTSWVGRAVDWIENYSRPDPFFLCIGFPGPHPPYDPTPEWLDLYADTEFELLPLQIKEYIQHPRTLIDMAEHNTQVAHDSIQFVTFSQRIAPPAPAPLLQWANVSMVDDWIGKIRAALESRDLLDDTVVVFTSDHGDTLTDHFCSQKWTMYDQVVRVPAIVWAPERFGGGRRVAEQVQWFDLGATILDIAGAEALPGGRGGFAPAGAGGPGIRGPRIRFLRARPRRRDGSVLRAHDDGALQGLQTRSLPGR